MSKRSGTAAREYLESSEHAQLSSPSKSFKEGLSGASPEYDFEHISDRDFEDDAEAEGYEGLVSLHACRARQD